MITKFKMYENENKFISFIPNDLIPYFETKVDIIVLLEKINEFFSYLFILSGNKLVTEFYCKRCVEMINGVVNHKHYNKKHKGVVYGVGSGINWNMNEVSLTLKLKRIRHKHEVNTSKPITIYGNIPENLLEIIDGVNMVTNSKKYNM